MAIDLVTILSTGAAAAVINQVLTWVIGWRRDLAANRREQYNTALALAVSLERYAIECASLIGIIHEELDEVTRTHSYDPIKTGSIPEFPMPSPIDWRWLSANFASDVLALPPQIKYSNGYVVHVGTYANPDDASIECIKHAGVRGLEAWRIAERIRPHYGLPPADYKLGAWKFLETLSEAAVPYPPQGPSELG